MLYVYVLESKTRFYVGSTDSIKRRLEEHNKGQNIATKPYKPWKLIFYECYFTKSDGIRRERHLKTTQGRQALKRMLKDYLEENKRYFDY